MGIEDPKKAGFVAILAGLLTPSGGVLPQVLAGLGMFGVLSAGCLIWLERLQPLFFVLALGSLAFQLTIYFKRPKFLRTWGIKAILFSSVLVNVGVIASWVALWYRYR